MTEIAQGSAASWRLAGNRTRTCSLLSLANSSRENPQYGVSTRTSTFAGATLTTFQRSRAVSRVNHVGANRAMSRSLVAVTARWPVASSKPTLPTGPQSSRDLSNCRSSQKRATRAGRLMRSRDAMQEGSCEGRSVSFTSARSAKSAQRSWRWSPRIPTATSPSGATVRRTTTQRLSAGDEVTHAGLAAPAELTLPDRSRRRSCTRGES
jgi:hypothetical protein